MVDYEFFSNDFVPERIICNSGFDEVPLQLLGNGGVSMMSAYCNKKCSEMSKHNWKLHLHLDGIPVGEKIKWISDYIEGYTIIELLNQKTHASLINRRMSQTILTESGLLFYQFPNEKPLKWHFFPPILDNMERIEEVSIDDSKIILVTKNGKYFIVTAYHGMSTADKKKFGKLIVQ